MKVVSDTQIRDRISHESVWWNSPHEIDPELKTLKKRAYFDLLLPLVRQRKPRRAVILLGPRRVGKTVLIHQIIQRLIEEGVSPNRICYVSLETPLYNGLGLERLMQLAWPNRDQSGNDVYYIFFDEIQYLRDWEIHLKAAFDTYKNVQFIASGSAAAALRLKSHESGAGRFTDFLLPPITFYEYLELLDKSSMLDSAKAKESNFTCADINALNEEFVNYLNYGGYPEAIFDPEIRKNPGRYIRSDIIDKVLLRDLPSLYGIQDIQELNSLFTTLAYNTGDEVTLDGLSRNSGVAKNTIKRYIEYLESAFLIKTVHRVDQSAKKFTRANFFKVYLTNPCMRSALFSPLGPDDEGFGHLAETAIFSQWFHLEEPGLYYARWNKGEDKGEVDIIGMGNGTSPSWCIEVKWSDLYFDEPNKLRSLRRFLRDHPACKGFMTTRTKTGTVAIDGRVIDCEPASIYCYALGHNIIGSKKLRGT